LSSIYSQSIVIHHFFFNSLLESLNQIFSHFQKGESAFYGEEKRKKKKKKRGAFDSAKNHKLQRRKRQSVTAKRKKSQTPKFV